MVEVRARNAGETVAAGEGVGQLVARIVMVVRIEDLNAVKPLGIKDGHPIAEGMGGIDHPPRLVDHLAGGAA